MIPKIFHQSWKTAQVPGAWQAWQRSWRSLNPGYAYRFWTDDDNRRLVAERFPDLLPVYEGYPLDINRADLARYLVLKHEGGIYADMDVECLRPIDGLLDGRRLVFALEPAAHAKAELLAPRGLGRMVGNAVMASVPDHPFWDTLLTLVPEAAGAEEVLDATGPLLLTRACDAFPDRSALSVLPPETVYPLDHEATRSLPAAEIHRRSAGAYAVHYWQGSWTPKAVLSLARRRLAKARQT